MRRVLVLVGLALLTLTACTTKTPGSATPTSSTGTAPPSGTDDQVPGPGVPRVENPIDTAKFATAPCSVLTDGQISEIFGGAAAPHPDPQGPSGPACSWRPSAASGASVQVIFPNVDKLGLTSIYQAKGSTYKLFEVLSPIDSYPVVAYGTSDARATDGVCAVAVGTSDHSTVEVSIFQAKANVGQKDPCDAARTVAAKVLDTIRKG